jgi:hypothetical protein
MTRGLRLRFALEKVLPVARIRRAGSLERRQSRVSTIVSSVPDFRSHVNDKKAYHIIFACNLLAEVLLEMKIVDLPIIQPSTTISGSTNSAICMLEPTATPIAKSILSLIDTVTAVACSAALPTMGSRIRPTNVFEIPLPSSVRASIEST